MKYIVTILALALVLSASALAGTQALIGSRQIADRSIRLVDIHPSAVTALRGRRGPRGPRGLQGEPGANGLQGPQGPAGAAGGFDPSKLTYVTGPRITILADDVGTASATCPTGTAVTGGGFYTSIAVPANSQAYSNNSWSVIVNNFGNLIPIDAYAFAVCAAG
jgi:hypothetical protein